MKKNLVLFFAGAAGGFAGTYLIRNYMDWLEFERVYNKHWNDLLGTPPSTRWEM